MTQDEIRALLEDDGFAVAVAISRGNVIIAGDAIDAYRARLLAYLDEQEGKS